MPQNINIEGAAYFCNFCYAMYVCMYICMLNFGKRELYRLELSLLSVAIRFTEFGRTKTVMNSYI